MSLTSPSPTRTVLVFDDDLSSFKGIRRIGQTSGFDTLHIADSQALISWASENLPQGADREQQYCMVIDTKFSDILSDPGIPEEILKLPRIYISRAGNIASSIACLKLGCNDFLEKPFRISQMRDSLESIFAAMSVALPESVSAMKTSYANLTKREREVFDLVASGLANKIISDQLNIALRTVKVHRANLMRKLAVKSLVELVRAHDLIHGAPQDPSRKLS